MSDAHALPRARSKQRRNRGPMPPGLKFAVGWMVVMFMLIAYRVIRIALGDPSMYLKFTFCLDVALVWWIWPRTAAEWRRWWNSGE